MKKNVPAKSAIAVASPVKKAAKKIAVRTDIPIQHVTPVDQKAIFSNHFVVQYENGVYHLMFFQVNPPLVLGTHEEKARTLQQLGDVQAYCTARIVVSAELLPKIIGALMENHGTTQAAAAGELDLIDVTSRISKAE